MGDLKRKRNDVMLDEKEVELLDYYAGCALVGLLSERGAATLKDKASMSEEAFEMASLMLMQRADVLQAMGIIKK